MADPRRRWYDNAPGPASVGGATFYVDRECILCSVCADLAPENFRISDDEDHDICFRQPRDEAELAACYDALAACPVEAIGDDGA